MISVLTFLNDKTAKIPEDAVPLFDENSPLTQLQLDDLWLNKGSVNWQCHPQILNCPSWADAWNRIHLSPLHQVFDDGELGQSQKVVIQIANNAQPQQWRFFAKSGLLESPAKNWYQIPPSQREALIPIIKADAFIEQ